MSTLKSPGDRSRQFSRSRRRSQTQSPSKMTLSTLHMIRNTPTGSGACSLTRRWSSKQFRGRFIGKCSPVNFYWGSFDLAVTRFSGRPAPKRPGADLITREAYSHECISAGFWPGAGFTGPAYYSYTAPAPPALETAPQDQASTAQDLKEFVLTYDDVRNSVSPRDTLFQFLQSDLRSRRQSCTVGPRSTGAHHGIARS